MSKAEAAPTDKVRLDKWLWAARFFKTRALATEAVNAGHVHLNGARSKPARGLAPGDRLTIRKGPYTFEIEVLGLAARRGPASAAEQLYREEARSRQRREALAAERRLHADGGAAPARRPDKRSRRRIIRFQRRED